MGLELNESAKWLDTADRLASSTYKEPAAGPIGVPSHAWQSGGASEVVVLAWQGLVGLRSEAGRRSVPPSLPGHWDGVDTGTV